MRIGLNGKNAAAFRKQLGPFIEHARKAGRAQTSPARAYRGQPQASPDIPGPGQKTNGDRGQ